MNDVCAGCGERATCEFDWGSGIQKACAAHDPLRPLYGASAARVPPYYRTISVFPALATTGHLGVAGGHLSYRSQMWC